MQIKTKNQLEITSYLSEWVKPNTQETTNIDNDVGKRECSGSVDRNANIHPLWKLKIKLLKEAWKMV